MTREEQDQDLATVITHLLASGWVEDGTISHYEVPVGQENVAVMGGRQRFTKGSWKASVGRYTVNFYQVGSVEYPRRGPDGKVCMIEGFGAVNLRGFKTHEVKAIQIYAEKLS
jgi:hypothetical protein